MDLVFNPENLAVFHQQTINHALSDIQVGLQFQYRLHPLSVKIPVILGPRALNGQTLAGIESSELNSGLIRIYGHLPAQGVNLLDKVALCQTSNGGITTHGSYVIEIDGEKQGGMAHSRRSEGGLTAGMTGADYNHVIFFIICGHEIFKLETKTALEP
jgi:hypothetical protein